VTSAPDVITDSGRFALLVDDLLAEPRYALDTEFHRERTYYPRLALLQIAWDGDLALVDPLAVDLAPLAQLFGGANLAVLHAADQDLEVLDVACGAIPQQLFDTQVGAGFLGLSSPSLASLHERYLGIRLPKGDRLTDWLARPLSSSQLRYAASDVEHLLALHDRLAAAIETSGRSEWAALECETLRCRDRSPRDPQLAWTRIKEARSLRGTKLAVAQELAAWREERARARDLPTRFVLADLAVVAIAQRLPETAKELRATRGVDGRGVNDGTAEEVLAVVARGLERGTPWTAPAAEGELDRKLRPAATLVATWLAQLARDMDLDPAVLGTRGDIEALLRGDESSRLAQGWRAEVAGDGIRRLVAGHASLAFDPGGKLVLEPRASASE
jgi:ribonuclease D